MKKLIVLMIASFVPAILLAQNTPLALLHDKYSGKPGIESAEIFPGSAGFVWEKTIDNSTLKDMLQNIESIRILKCKMSAENNKQEKLWKKMQKAAGDEQYKEVVSVNAENITANIYMIKDNVGRATEVALLTEYEDGILMVTVTGKIDLSSIFSSENMESLREIVEYYMKNKGDCKPE